MRLEDGNRPRGMLDVSYIAYFPVYQKPVLQNLIREINEHHDPHLIEDFAKMFETGKPMTFSDESIEPDHLISKGDVLTNNGVTRYLDAIRGVQGAFRYMTTGNGSGTVNQTNTALFAEQGPRQDMSNANVGWREQHGMKLFFGAIYGELDGWGTSIYTELAINTSSSSGIILNHTHFGTATVLRTSNGATSFFAAIAVYAVFLELCPALP